MSIKKNIRRRAVLEKLEAEFIILREEHERKLRDANNEHVMGWIGYSSRYLYVESQIRALKNNLKGE